MKNVLSQLHNIINELENNDFVKEAHILNNLFTKLAVSDPMNFYKPPALKTFNGVPNFNVTEFTSGHPKIDSKIHKTKEYRKLRDEWIKARDLFISVGANPNPDIYQPRKAKYEAAEETLEAWYVVAYQEVAAGKPVPPIIKMQMEDITDERNKQSKPVSKPVVKQVEQPVSKPVVKPNKPISKPVEETSKPSAPKSVQKPVAPKPVLKPKQEIKKPIQDNSNYMPYGAEYEASNYFEKYKTRTEELGSKVKAYNEMQAQVYNSDKTKGKQIYREWEKLVNSDNK